MAQEILNHVAMSYVFSPKYDPEARVVLLIAQMGELSPDDTSQFSFI